LEGFIAQVDILSVFQDEEKTMHVCFSLRKNFVLSDTSASLWKQASSPEDVFEMGAQFNEHIRNFLGINTFAVLFASDENANHHCAIVDAAELECVIFIVRANRSVCIAVCCGTIVLTFQTQQPQELVHLVQRYIKTKSYDSTDVSIEHVQAIHDAVLSVQRACFALSTCAQTWVSSRQHVVPCVEVMKRLSFDSVGVEKPKPLPAPAPSPVTEDQEEVDSEEETPIYLNRYKNVTLF
jgi:hypothetical protein